MAKEVTVQWGFSIDTYYECHNVKFNLSEDKEIMRLYNKLLDRDEAGNQNCCEVHS